MPLLHLPCSHLHVHVSSSPPLAPILVSLRPTPRPSRSKPTSQNRHARDRVIDFGKHKGRMLGTLPSKYLLWVSKNLRARDFEEWAHLADEVLDDPVYKDRIEWEAAEKVLTGDGLRGLGSDSGSSVSELLEISERFGWDNDDKAGWARVDFELLGTSLGGRIPRVRTELIGETGSPEMGWRSKGEKKGGIFGGDLMISTRSAKKRDVSGGVSTSSMNGGMGSRRMDQRPKGEKKGEILGGDLTVSARGEKKLEVLGGNSIVSRLREMGPSVKDWRLREERKDGILSTDSKDLTRQRMRYPEKETGVGTRDGDFRNRKKLGILTGGQRCYIEDERKEEESVRDRREESRERRRLMRKQQVEASKREVTVGEGTDGSDEAFMKKGGIRRDGGLSVNPFPGRGALLDKIKTQRG